MRIRFTLYGFLAVAAMACQPVFFWDLVVSWSIEGSTSSSLCSTYNIGEFEIVADGPEYRARNFSCPSWESGSRFFSLEEGHYTVSVRALEKGSLKVLAQRSEVILVQDDQVAFEPDRVKLTLRAADFSGGGKPRINFFWNINNTVDGTAKGKSWDTCAEVGAAKAVMTLQKITASGSNDGAATSVSADCHSSGSMSAAVNVVAGNYKVSVKLIDSGDKDLTTATSMEAPLAKLTGISTSTPGEFVADFYWYSFKQGKADSITGSYLFNLTFGDKATSCTSSTPNVKGVALSLSRLTSVAAGTYKLVTASVCTEAGTCFNSDGAASGACQDSSKKYSIKSLTWGLYKGSLTGQTTGLEICWKQTSFKDSDVPSHVADLLVGAGEVNPVRKINVPKDKTNTSKACNP